MWAVLWAAIWFAPDGSFIGRAIVKAEEPTFATRDECESKVRDRAFRLENMKGLSQHLKLPPGYRLAIEGVCEAGGQEI